MNGMHYHTEAWERKKGRFTEMNRPDCNFHIG